MLDRLMDTSSESRTQKFIHEYILITVGTLLVTAGVYFFKYPNNFSTGGVSGISVIVNGIFPFITKGQVTTVVNLSLLVIGYLVIGKEFGIKTVYSSLLMTFVLDILEVVYPMSKPLTTQPILELIFAIFLPAIGSSILFSTGASTGGTDIVAMIVKKFSTLNISMALFYSDLLIVVACAFVFGPETGLFSFVGLAAKAFVVNDIIDGIYRSKYFTVITDPEHEPAIREFITNTLHRGATINDTFIGSYSGRKRVVILTVLNRSESRMLKDFVKKTDPQAFNIITNTSEILGKGFREAL